jgi:hypothetical protein
MVTNVTKQTLKLRCIHHIQLLHVLVLRHFKQNEAVKGNDLDVAGPLDVPEHDVA